MISEFAVEPAAIGADWGTFRLLIEKFGTDKGRLISRMPNKWEKKVIQAAKDADMPDIRRAKIIEHLHSAKFRVADFGRVYDHETSWTENAVREHGLEPFCAIIFHGETKPCAESLTPDDCTDDNHLFEAPISRDVARTADDIADAVFPLAMVSSEIDMVDPYFDLRPMMKGKYVKPLASLLAKLAASRSAGKVVRIHFRTHPSRPPDHLLVHDAPRQMAGIIPRGYTLELHEWSDDQGEENFHDRFFLTDVGGLMIGAGFSAEGPAETAAFTLLDVEHAQRLRSRFSATSTAYVKVGSPVRIDANGNAVLFLMK